MSELIDPRWAQLKSRKWKCLSCDELHSGLFDLDSWKPDAWPGPGPVLPNTAIVGAKHCLTEDFCILNGEHHFIRCVLRLPLVGAPDEYFGFGVWSSLARQNFERYLQTFDSGEQGGLGPWFAWFSNRLKGYPDTLNLKSRVHPQSGRQRPWIELEPTGHPLARESIEGVTYERVLEIYAANGHRLGAIL